MNLYPLSLQRLVRELSKLPSIGEKSAMRLAYYLVNDKKDVARSVAESLLAASESIGLCSECFFFCETGSLRDKQGFSLEHNTLCPICIAPGREKTVFCIVEKPVDVVAIEKTGEFNGLYHVLHGLWSPLKGVGTDEIKLDELMKRVNENGVKEVILGLNATIEGDATCLYICDLLREKSVNVTRLAQGMPKGGELEYSDEVTITRAFHGRVQL
jgi:recombination protein RecR